MEYTAYIKQTKDKYVREGFSALDEREKCDLLLSYAAPQKDLRASSERLVEDCGGCTALFRYAHRSFLTDYGISDSAVLFPEIMLAIVSRAMSEIDKTLPLDDETIGRMLVYKYLGKSVETVYLTLLDGERRLIDSVLISEGSVNDAMLASRKLLEHAITRRAKYAVLSHNHPSGEAIASDADKMTTEMVAQAFSYAGISFIGHYIVADKEYSVIKEM